MKYYLIEDRCVICGEPVPEGMWCCPSCEKRINSSELEANPINLTAAAPPLQEEETVFHSLKNRLITWFNR